MKKESNANEAPVMSPENYKALIEIQNKKAELEPEGFRIFAQLLNVEKALEALTSQKETLVAKRDEVLSTVIEYDKQANEKFNSALEVNGLTGKHYITTEEPHLILNEEQFEEHQKKQAATAE